MRLLLEAAVFALSVLKEVVESALLEQPHFDVERGERVKRFCQVRRCEWFLFDSYMEGCCRFASLLSLFLVEDFGFDMSRVDSSKVSSEEVGSNTSGFGKGGKFEVDESKVSEFEVSPTKVDVAEIGVAEIDVAEVSPTKIDVAEVSFAEIGTSKFGSVEVSFLEDSFLEDGLGKDGSAEISPAKISFVEMSFTQVSIAEVSVAEVSFAKSEMAEVSVANILPLKIQFSAVFHLPKFLLHISACEPSFSPARQIVVKSAHASLSPCLHLKYKLYVYLLYVVQSLIAVLRSLPRSPGQFAGPPVPSGRAVRF